MPARTLEESVEERAIERRFNQLVTLKQIKLYCKQASIKAVERLIRIAESDDDVVALRAIEMILNRGFGAPQQHVEITAHGVVSREPLSPDQWEKLYGSSGGSRNGESPANSLGPTERTTESVN